MKTETKLADYKTNFINLGLGAGALKADGITDYPLKSKRSSPYFLNVGDFNAGSTTSGLASAYANIIAEHFKDVPNLLLYGIPEKGVGFVSDVSAKLWDEHKIESHWFFTRKMPKTYGEAAGTADTAKPIVVGKVPTAEDNIILLDDVLTTGESKYEALETIKKLVNNPNIKGLVIGADRQEVMVGIGGQSAVEEFTKTTGIPVYSAVNATEIRQHLSEGTDQNQKGAARIATYLRVYGTKEARDAVAPVVTINNKIIKTERGVIVACDVSEIEDYERIVAQTSPIDGIVAFKVGFSLVIPYSLTALVEIARKYTEKPIIYDHQKGATDVPDTGLAFMKAVKKSGARVLILFAESGPETERAWIYRALDSGLTVIIGGPMTHPAYLKSEGGFITDDGALEMCRIGARAGVTNFVVPGTKPDVIKLVRDTVQSEGVENPVFFAPGMVTQGGEFGKVISVLGNNWYPIVGRDITGAKDNYAVAAQRSVDQFLRG